MEFHTSTLATASSNATIGTSNLAEWPELPAINDSQTVYVDMEESWLQRRCPPELKLLPAKLPSVVARILGESTREEFLRSSERQEVRLSQSFHDMMASTRNLASGPVAEAKPGGQMNASGSNPPKVAGSSKVPSKSRRAKAFMKRLLKRMSTKAECVSCRDRVPRKNLIKLPCKHKYCSTCLKQMAHVAIADEMLFPPKCCAQEIPSKKVLSTLSPQHQAVYSSKKYEYRVPITDRWYCPKPNCGSWIPQEHLKRDFPLQMCLDCSTLICSGCRGTAHFNSACSRDPGLTAVLEQAQLKQWQRCYNCGAVVELTFGCHQVTCRCKAQFCYTCGNPWASCSCVTAQAQDERPVDYLGLAVDGGRDEDDSESDFAAVITAIESSNGEGYQYAGAEEETASSDDQRRLAINERVGVLGEFLSEINRLQQARLIDRQKEERAALISRQLAEEEKWEKERAEAIVNQRRTAGSRVEKLMSTQSSVFEKLRFEHKQEEASLVDKFPLLFKGLPNAEVREMVLINKLRAMQDDDTIRLKEEYNQVLWEINAQASIEQAALESSLQAQRRTQRKAKNFALRSLVQETVYDRFWFEQVVAKREELLESYRVDLMNGENELGELSFVESDGHIHESHEVMV